MVFVRNVCKIFTLTFTISNKSWFQTVSFHSAVRQGARGISILKIVNQDGEVADTVLIDKLNRSIHFQKAKFK